ncbi:MAG TPA: tetratricopeptide repeat protein [Blastocatellia bacterium]|nr:tetratricopeptide repeat protein [Blastocatellia bacterium]
MIIDLSLKSTIARAAVLLAGVAFASLLVLVIISKFIIGTMSDNRKQFSSDELASPVYHFPGSARLHARLAEAEMFDRDRDLALAESHALAAVKLSPHDFRFPLILASVKEAAGDRQAAGEQLRKALVLAPNNQSVRYRLANLLLREGRLEESVEEFRVAVATETKLLAATIDLIWQASGNDLSAIERVTADDARAQMTLAQFLAKQSRADDAARVFNRIDRAARLASAETPLFLKSLIDTGNTVVARELWAGLWGAREVENPLVWNGSFETDISRNLGQFDWVVLNKESKYARLGIDRTTAHTGARSLKVEFTGENTTRLDGEIKQLIALKPGVRYRLEGYAKSEGLVTTEGPRLAVTGGVSTADPKQEPASEPVAAGSTDWQRLTVDFVAPQTKVPGQSSVVIAIKRIPKYSYDEPTRGVIWFDDFTIKEQ